MTGNELVQEVQIELSEIRDDDQRQVAAWYVYRTLSRLFAEIDWQAFRAEVDRQSDLLASRY